VLPRFWRFALIGCVGYCVDVAVLYAATTWSHAGPYRGRLLSFVCAATVTWALNRRFTFHDMRSREHAKEWAKFVCLNGLGGAVNYAVYALFIYATASSPFAQAIGVALGSLSGLSINYFVSRHLVFVSAR
jgi:putative flippase GtrA